MSLLFVTVDNMNMLLTVTQLARVRNEELTCVLIVIISSQILWAMPV